MSNPHYTFIMGYASSSAKDYATKYNRTFEVISTTPDFSGMTGMKTTQSIFRDVHHDISKPHVPNKVVRLST